MAFIFSCSFENGGVPPKFVIIDDGWQSVSMDSTGVGFLADNTAKWAIDVSIVFRPLP